MSIIKMLIDSGKPTSKFLTYPPKYLQHQNSKHFLRTKVRSQFPAQRILTRTHGHESPISSVVLVTLCLTTSSSCPTHGNAQLAGTRISLPPASLFLHRSKWPLTATSSFPPLSLISLSSPSSSHGTIIIIVMVIIN